MKVIMIGSHLRVKGGITRVIKNYIEAGIQEKSNFEFLATYYGSNHFVNIFFYIFQYIKLFTKLYLFNFTYDVAHIHMSYRGSFLRKKYIIRILNKKSIPIVLHMHGSQFKDFYNESTTIRKKQIVKTLDNVNVILALGEQWKKYYESISKTKVVTLNNAVFPKKNVYNDKEKIYITTMGVLSKRKGTYDLIEVALRLKDKIEPKYKFILAGNGEIEKVKRKIKELNVEDLFIIPGWISDQEKLDDIYRKTIVYVLPSYNEGMPMSILEAMSYGLPIISTNVGSIPSVVNDKNGFIINPGDIDSLVKIINRLLDNPESISKYKKNNVYKIANEYNVYVSLDKILTLYKKVVDSKNI